MSEVRMTEGHPPCSYPVRTRRCHSSLHLPSVSSSHILRRLTDRHCLCIQSTSCSSCSFKIAVYIKQMLFTSEKLCLIVCGQPQHGKLVGSDGLDNAVEPCGNVITAKLLFLHIAMPSHLRHLFKRHGGVQHIV